MRVARQYQQPLSVIRGRTVAAGEPVWSPDDLDVAVAYEGWLLEQRASACGRCGTKREDWIDERGRRRKIPTYVPEVVDCPGCQARAEADPGSNDPGVKQGWRRVELVPYDPPDTDAD